MRQSQIEKLQDLRERLADVFLDEADPRNWPGAGVKQADMEQKDRGDRVWIKKNAMGTVNLICRITTLLAPTPLTGGLTPDDDKELSDMRKAAEKEASALLGRLNGQAPPPAKPPTKKANAKSKG